MMMMILQVTVFEKQDPLLSRGNSVYSNIVIYRIFWMLGYRWVSLGLSEVYFWFRTRLYKCSHKSYESLGYGKSHGLLVKVLKLDFWVMVLILRLV